MAYWHLAVQSSHVSVHCPYMQSVLCVLMLRRSDVTVHIETQTSVSQSIPSAVWDTQVQR